MPSPREPVEAMKDLEALRQLLDQRAGHSPLAGILDPKPVWRMDPDSWCWQVLYPNTEAEIRMNAPLSRGVHFLRSLSSFVYVRGDPRIVGIEVKSGGTLRQLSGSHAFRTKRSPSNCLVVGGGGEPLGGFLGEPAQHRLGRR